MKFLLISICLMVGGCMSLPFGITNNLQLSEVESKIETKEKKSELTKKRRNQSTISSWNSHVKFGWVRNFF
jgi:starvation-inducible outer membrane lipoprotein